MRYDTVVVTGPTASGKTAKAVALARLIGGEIVSADSRQVFRGMDLGTGKDLDEYGDVPYHLIDVVPAGYHYNLYEFLRDSRAAIDDIAGRGRVPVVCGGTGMYVEALAGGVRLPNVRHNEHLRRELEPLSMEQLATRLAALKRLHNHTDLDTRERAIRAIEIATYLDANPNEAEMTTAKPNDKVLIVAVDIPREQRRRRISERLDARLDAGMVDEVRGLLDAGVPADVLLRYGLEYKYVTLYALGRISYNEMHDQLETAIHQFAKRQMTWFRGMERRGYTLHYLPYDLAPEAFAERVSEMMSRP